MINLLVSGIFRIIGNGTLVIVTHPRGKIIMCAREMTQRIKLKWTVDGSNVERLT